MDAGIDVVVVNYRTPMDLDGFCESLKTHGGDNFKLIIANVCPQEGDLEVTKKWRKKSGLAATSISFPQNVGYALAANEAATHSDRETLAIFNADVRLLPDTLQDCHQALQRNPSWGILGPCQFNERGLVTHAGIFGSLSTPAHRGWLSPSPDSFNDVRRAVTVSGAAYFIKRQVWAELTACPIYSQAAPDALGAFLPTPFYFEETACSYHAQAHGWDVVYYGKARCVHKWHAAVREHGRENWANQCFQVSRELFRAFCDMHGIAHD